MSDETPRPLQILIEQIRMMIAKGTLKVDPFAVTNALRVMARVETGELMGWLDEWTRSQKRVACTLVLERLEELAAATDLATRRLLQQLDAVDGNPLESFTVIDEAQRVGANPLGPYQDVEPEPSRARVLPASIGHLIKFVDTQMLQVTMKNVQGQIRADFVLSLVTGSLERVQAFFAAHSVDSDTDDIAMDVVGALEAIRDLAERTLQGDRLSVAAQSVAERYKRASAGLVMMAELGYFTQVED
jgi:hypothetical protein